MYRNNQNYDNGQYAKNTENDKKNIYIYLILLTICAIILLVYISYTLKINNLSYKIEKVQNEIQVLEDKNHKLSIKVSNLNSLSQIDEIARTELNMIEPQSMHTLVMQREEIQLASEPERRFFLSQVTEFFSNLGTVRAYSPE
ncbi:MAG: cell division protein FtsL [Halanaerobiales bacterium]|nr:cell division protein FtsL [Halanaerobiales bacterium]